MRESDGAPFDTLCPSDRQKVDWSGYREVGLSSARRYAAQVVLRRQLRRRNVLAFFQKLSPCLVGIEACASSHHWSRELQALGHTVDALSPASLPTIRIPNYATARRLGLFQPNRLTNSEDQKREQRQDEKEDFKAFAAPLFELVIQIQVPSFVHTRRVRLAAPSAPRFAHKAPDLIFFWRPAHFPFAFKPSATGVSTILIPLLITALKTSFMAGSRRISWAASNFESGAHSAPGIGSGRSHA